MGCVLAAVASAQAADPWLRPFAPDSIWNTAIPSDATYEPANLPASSYIGCDLEWHIKVAADDPIYPVFSPSTWEKRWPGVRLIGELQFPDDLIIPDADPPDTPNACAAFLMPDGRTIRQLEPACRRQRGKHIVGWLHPEDQDLLGPGIKGTHYGSGLSALGGSIRPGELTGKEPIRHALKLNVWGKHLYYGEDVPGFRWPADRSDEDAETLYQGKNPKLVMGTLLALPRSASLDTLGVSTEAGAKIFDALKKYGAYVTDNTGWDAYDLCMSRTVPDEVKAKFGYTLAGASGPFVDEMKRMVQALEIVNPAPR
ncbi:MAG TPA: hypothetical protein VIH35_03615 [Kiritimatiellia bacterium]